MGAPAAQSTLVIVVGAGRSGTSGVAGALQALGLRVPQPEVEADPSNPRGFFEPRWVVDFHAELMHEAEIAIADARPQAVAQAERVGSRTTHRCRLQDWLSDLDATGDELVVKDPRTSWFQGMWQHAAPEVGLSARFLTMLRHPAEVSGSRQTYYRSGESPAARRAGTITRVAGWVNLNLASEQQHRDHRRVFVGYPDLLADWRSALYRVHERLGLTCAADLDWGKPHALDDFIDPALRRHADGWADVEVPAQLRDIAEEVWRHLGTLATGDGFDSHALKTLEGLRADYDLLFADAHALSRRPPAARRGRGRRPDDAPERP
ncbi:MAG: sulfotransferase [Actinomycetota bacterium]|nr:sulfotransferase [Actinomycetota bacterium]